MSWQQQVLQLPTTCATHEVWVVLVNEEGSAASAVLVASDLT
jgi:hypothetical protein